MNRNQLLWREVLNFFKTKIDAAESSGDVAYTVWLQRLLEDFIRYFDR